MADLLPDATHEVVLKLTPDEVRREAIGKVLSLVGTFIGIAGTLTVLSINPAVKSAAGAVWSKTPKTVRDRRALYLGVAAVGGAVALAYVLNRAFKKQGAEA